jgi:hypothetical protein
MIESYLSKCGEMVGRLMHAFLTGVRHGSSTNVSGSGERLVFKIPTRPVVGSDPDLHPPLF